MRCFPDRTKRPLMTASAMPPLNRAVPPRGRRLWRRRVPGPDGYFCPDVFRNGRFCGHVRRRWPRRPEDPPRGPVPICAMTWTLRWKKPRRVKTKKLEIERLVTCKACHGTGARDGKEAFKTCPTCQGGAASSPSRAAFSSSSPPAPPATAPGKSSRTRAPPAAGKGA